MLSQLLVLSRWVLWALLLAILRSRGLGRLTGAEAVTPSNFAAAFPDQSDWVPRLLKAADRAGVVVRHSLQDLLTFCKLEGEPPEYATMHMCIWGTPLLPEGTEGLFEQQPLKIRRWIQAYCREQGMWPHPITTAKHFLEA